MAPYRPDDFIDPSTIAEMQRDVGRGQNPSKRPNTLFGGLAHGDTIGKRIIIPSPIGNPAAQKNTVLNMLQIGSIDAVAQQLNITLAPPRIIPATQFVGGIVPVDGTVQSASGERDNSSILSSPPVPGAGFEWTSAVAKVEWGIGGVQSFVECDFSNGLCINICASWIRVGAFVNNIPNGFFGAAYVLSAFIGPGFPKANNAQRSFNIGNVEATGGPANGMSAVFPVPFYAKEVVLSARNGGAVPPGLPLRANNTLDANINFYGGIQGTNPMASYHFSPTLDLVPKKIPNGAYYWAVQNNDPVNGIFDANVIFDLAV